ncbi:apolipoprotein N-acyltransferase [Bacteroidetes/Chlorobi group bacterium ChocPot_Mid]|nr:MAG: apolipoprotein N-acyltransferase [Bacteroidetes/Chlorobi group bacterium ChocPot_Mid]
MITKTQTYIIGWLTGILLALAFPPFPFHFIAFFAFIPLLFSLEVRKGEKSFWLIYITFFIYHTMTNWWIGSWQTNADPFLMASGIILSFFHPLFFLVPVYSYLFIRKKYGLSFALWLFPFIWTAFEWLHSLGELNYPWLTIGYTQAYNIVWLQFADISGIWGVSFIIILINSLLARLFINENSLQFSLLNCQKVKGIKFIFLSVVLLILFPYIYGIFRINEFEHSKIIKKNKNVKIGIVQPNINPWAKWERNVPEQIRLHLKLQDSLLKYQPDIDFFLWSETAIPYQDLNMNSSHDFGELKYWVDYRDIAVLTGLADIKLYRKGDRIPKTVKQLEGTDSFYYESFNAAVIINPDLPDSLYQIYHKMRLTPFSERFPYGKYLSFATEWFKWGVGISSWNTGEKQFPLLLNRKQKSEENKSNLKSNVKIGAVICIESIYPDFTREYVNQGAGILVVITNDAWFNHTFGPEQHFIMSQVRAIETRRYIARCANSGISGFISPSGEIIKLMEQYKVIADAESVPILKDKSIYVLLGDWLVYLCTMISLIFIIYGFSKKNQSFLK